MEHEANPHHPTTEALRGKWHIIAAILVKKLGGHAVISMEDLAGIEQGSGLSARELHDGIHLKTVAAIDVPDLARKEGGLPC